MDPNRQTVAVLFGGRSVEHEISIITGLQLLEALDSTRYAAVPVYVAQDGAWYTGEVLSARSSYRNLSETLAQAERVALLPIPGTGGLTRLARRRGWFGPGQAEIIPIDVYFPVFHGTYGEDGCVQGLLELADVAYCGSGVLPSALGMDKFLTKMVAQGHQVPVLPGELVGKRELAAPSAGRDPRAQSIAGGDPRAHQALAAVRRRVMSSLSYPLFVKPCSLGSSVGIGRAADDREFDAALLRVFEIDQFALVEPCVAQPLEINVAVLAGDPPQASVVEVPVVEGGGILGYDEKYLRQQGAKSASLAEGTAGTARVIDPVDLPAALKTQAREHAVTVFKALRCAGVARVDFLCNLEADRLYFNEINTLPGSLAYYLWAESKPPILYTELLTRIIEQAVEDREAARALGRSFGFRSLLGARG